MAVCPPLSTMVELPSTSLCVGGRKMDKLIGNALLMRQLLVIGTVGAAMYLLSTTNVWGIGLGFVMLFVSLLLSTTVRAYGRESRNRRGF